MSEIYQKSKRLINELTVYLLIVLSVLFVNTQIIQLSFIPSGSMIPTIDIGSLVMSTKYDIADISRYDIVTFSKDNTVFIKRVIGLPNEKIEIKNNILYVDGKEIKSAFINEPMIYEDFSYKVPDGMYFVMGDNRNNSQDSRYFGAIKKKDILAKGKFVIYPNIKKLEV